MIQHNTPAAHDGGGAVQPPPGADAGQGVFILHLLLFIVIYYVIYCNAHTKGRYDGGIEVLKRTDSEVKYGDAYIHTQMPVRVIILYYIMLLSYCIVLYITVLYYVTYAIGAGDAYIYTMPVRV